MSQKIAYQGITFDDVLLEPSYSEVVPSEVNVGTTLTKRIRLQIPILSSPMDTVTEAEMAIALSQEGGIGVIHKNMSIDRQTEEVDKVKRSANGIIVNPVTLPPTATVAQARELMAQANVSGVPVTDASKKLLGIITRRDLRFQESEETLISLIMTKEKLVTATGNVTLEQAEKILMINKVEKLLLVDEDNTLTGLITIKDIDMMKRYPRACKDKLGRLRVGAAVGVHDYDRVESLLAKGVDLLVVDSAHGHSSNVIETVRTIKQRFDIDVVAGNVATKEGVLALVKAGADAVKVGIGPGSICTTRVISGVGVPQISAIMAAAEAAQHSGTPIIADGGIRYSGDVTKAIAAGANTVMLGGLLAGVAESPGQQILYQGRTFKSYRGMDPSVRWSRVPANAIAKAKRIADPISWSPRGRRARALQRTAQYVYLPAGRRTSSRDGYCGAKDIDQLRREARFIQVSAASVRESHPHDIAITQESPNYSTSQDSEKVVSC